jgi:hypothetical protein
MSGAPSFDYEQNQHETRHRLEGLNPQAVVVFAARCAWRVAPLMVRGSHEWLQQQLENAQAALVVALLRARGDDRIPSPASAVAASISDANMSSAAFNAAYAAAFAAASAVEVGNDVRNAANATASTAAEAAGEMRRFFIDAHDADLAALQGEWSSERLLEQPLWQVQPAFLDEIWKQWQDMISRVPAVGVFFELMQRIHQGEPDWERLWQVFENWWAQHTENPDSESRLPSDTEAKPESIKRTKAAEKSPSDDKPSEPRTRRIIQQRLVSTTSVTTDGEAEKLTPTARNCMLALREFLVSDETLPPLTVAVEAPWGGGKSSLMRHLQDALTNEVDAKTKQRPFKEEPIPTVWFNPWKHEAGKTLWAAFAVAFERQMAERCSRWERTKKRTHLAWQRLEMTEKAQLVLRLAFWIVAFITLACLAWQQTHAATVADWKDRIMQHAPWLGMIVTVWAFLKDAVNQLGSPLKLDVSRLLTHNDHADQVDDLHRFHEDFRRLMHAYIPKRQNGKPGKAVVFIDDLDRCEAPKAAELLQSLHQMLNVQERSRTGTDKVAPGVICVLGMDREKVAAAVAAKHEKLLPLLMEAEANGKVSRANAMIFGHEFLEKFIQLTLHLPAIQGNDLEEYLVSITGAKKVEQVTNTKQKPPEDRAKSAEPDSISITSSAGKLPSVASDPLIAAAIERREQAAVAERVERVSEDLGDGSLALQCAKYVAAALENNPRKLKQFVNLFRLRLYLAAAMNFLDLPEHDADKQDVEPLSPVAPGKISVYHMAKLVALDLALPAEMSAIRDAPSQKIYPALERACPADTRPALHDLIVSRDVFQPDAYDLGKAGLEAYFHYFRIEPVKPS